MVREVTRLKQDAGRRPHPGSAVALGFWPRGAKEKWCREVKPSLRAELLSPDFPFQEGVSLGRDSSRSTRVRSILRRHLPPDGESHRSKQRFCISFWRPEIRNRYCGVKVKGSARPPLETLGRIRSAPLPASGGCPARIINRPERQDRHFQGSLLQHHMVFSSVCGTSPSASLL